MNARLTEQYATLYRDEHLRRADMRRMAASASQARRRDRRAGAARDLYLHWGLKRLGTAAAGLLPA